MEQELLTLPTDREGVTLRQLSLEDAPAYFESWNASIDEIAHFEPRDRDKYDTLEKVQKSMEVSRKTRMGIWDGDTFVGSVSLRPTDSADEVELGYWVDSRRTGKGYASLAAKALTKYAADRYPKVVAEVAPDNIHSVKILEKSGFQQTSRQVGEFIIYELTK